MPDRYICIHGHFYQPPRENPWLEAIEQQDSARPYHDWNQRITAECYAPNTAARILDHEGRIQRMINNYSRISFNVGPTLLSWLQDYEPETYAAILEADRQSQRRFSGHGSAMAQAYNHLIMPLADARDQETQVIWGIEDFRRRFGRDPEGMWLPETAVDLATLDVLAQHGIRFTILAPHQAKGVRPIAGSPLPPGGEMSDGAWRQTPGGHGLDVSMPYRVSLPSGRTIAVFFYNGPVSRAIAFEGLLRNGGDFALQLLWAFPPARATPRLVHVASDGETYGHHHRYGEMALAYALQVIESQEDVALTNYGEFLKHCPPTHEAQIADLTSWSCAHGVERWRSDCGCAPGSHEDWHQRWRAPLREALDWLRDQLRPRYERAAEGLLKDPWAARDAYISVLLDPSLENRRAFLAARAVEGRDQGDASTVWKLLELQRNALLMYTSCGWFFEDLSGIEAVQVLRYAGRALHLVEELSSSVGARALLPVPDRGLEEEFLRRLERAPSNDPQRANGRVIYEQFVRPARVDLLALAAHFAISSLFEEYGDETEIYCYLAEREAWEREDAGEARLLLGRARVTSTVTGEFATVMFGVLDMGGPNVHCGVRRFGGLQGYQQLVEQTKEAFNRADFAQVIRLFDKHLGYSTHSLRTLFKDEQRKVLNQVLASTGEEVERSFRQVYQHHAATLRFLASLGSPPPKGLAMAAEFVLDWDLQQALGEVPPDLERVWAVMEEARLGGITIHGETLAFELGLAIGREAGSLAQAPWDVERVRRLEALVGLAQRAKVEVDLWRPQNVCYAMLQGRWAREVERARGGSGDAAAWIQAVTGLAERLRVRAPAGIGDGDSRGATAP